MAHVSHIGYEAVQLQSTQLASLPPQIGSLNETLASLREKIQENTPSTSDSSSFSLPLDATRTLLSERQKESEALDQQIKYLQQALPQKTRELEKAENELRLVEAQKELAVQGAREAMGTRGVGVDGVNELEMRGRWLRGVEATLKSMLQLDTAA